METALQRGGNQTHNLLDNLDNFLDDLIDNHGTQNCLLVFLKTIDHSKVVGSIPIQVLYELAPGTPAFSEFHAHLA